MNDEECLRWDLEFRERYKRERAAQLLPFHDFCSYSLRTNEWKGWEHQEEAERLMANLGWEIVSWAPGTLWLDGISALHWPHSKWISKEDPTNFMELAFARPFNRRHSFEVSRTFALKFQIYQIEMLAILGEGRDAYPYYTVLRKTQVHNSLGKAFSKLMNIEKMPTEEQKLQRLAWQIESDRNLAESLQKFREDTREARLKALAQTILDSVQKES